MPPTHSYTVTHFCTCLLGHNLCPVCGPQSPDLYALLLLCTFSNTYLQDCSTAADCIQHAAAARLGGLNLLWHGQISNCVCPSCFVSMMLKLSSLLDMQDRSCPGNVPATLRNIMHGKMQPLAPQTSAACADVIKQCLTRNAKTRISLNKLAGHPWVTANAAVFRHQLLRSGQGHPYDLPPASAKIHFAHQPGEWGHLAAELSGT